MGDVPSRPSLLRRFLPPLHSRRHHLLLAVVAIFVLGPLAGISAAFMNFSIGFFVGGQVLAGILGSTITLPYGPEGKHSANYMQTMASSVAGMCGMAVLVQAMTWLGLPEPASWKLVLFFMCIGMFGVGVGMLYTPILVDKMRLAFPSGFAVANILRALTDVRLLRRSIAKLGGGMLGGFAGGLVTNLVSANSIWLSRIGLSASQVAQIDSLGFSTSTFGASMIVGARIALPALVVALVGRWMTPWLIAHQWLEEGSPFRKIGFVIALGMIMGAAVVDIVLLLVQAAKRWRSQGTVAVPAAEDWKRVNQFRLVLWVLFWGTGIVLVGSQVLHQPVWFLTIAVVLCFLFVFVNGISLGISDSNPISAAFVMTVFIFAALGLRDAGVGLMCASILLIACSEGGDMQQDRSTGWRLGTNRIVQFRYQVIGIAMGAVLAVALAKVFMSAYPVLKLDQFSNPHAPGVERWQSAMTYKFVGALQGLAHPKPCVMHALGLGVALGLVTEVLRKVLRRLDGYQRFIKSGRLGWTVDFTVDAILLPSPYASSFGGFVELNTMYWWAGGGVFASLYEWAVPKFSSAAAPATGELPADMSTMSLVGGGLIAGESLAALAFGLVALAQNLF